MSVLTLIALVILVIFLFLKNNESNQIIMNTQKTIAQLKEKHSAADWDFINEHPATQGASARAMLDDYRKFVRDPKNNNPFLSVIENRKAAGFFTNYEGGDNLQFLSKTQMLSLIDYCKKDLPTLVFAIQFIESENVRAASMDTATRNLIVDVDYANMALSAPTMALTLHHNQRISLAKEFYESWYLANFLE